MPDETDRSNPARPMPMARPRGGRLTQAQIEDALRQAGWDEKYIPRMSAIAMGESGGRIGPPRFHGRPGQRLPEESVGLLQINMVDPARRRKYDINRLETDPIYNAKAALDIFKGGHRSGDAFRHWGAYTNGSYRKWYKGQALPGESAGNYGADTAPADPTPTTPVGKVEVGYPVTQIEDDKLNQTPERVAAWNKAFPGSPIVPRMGQMAQATAQEQLAGLAPPAVQAATGQGQAAAPFGMAGQVPDLPPVQMPGVGQNAVAPQAPVAPQVPAGPTPQALAGAQAPPQGIQLEGGYVQAPDQTGMEKGAFRMTKDGKTFIAKSEDGKSFAITDEHPEKQPLKLDGGFEQAPDQTGAPEGEIRLQKEGKTYFAKAGEGNKFQVRPEFPEKEPLKLDGGYEQAPDQTGVEKGAVRMQKDGKTFIAAKSADGKSFAMKAEVERPAPTEADFQEWRKFNKVDDTPETRKSFAAELEASKAFGKDVEVGAALQQPGTPGQQAGAMSTEVATRIPANWKAAQKNLTDEEFGKTKIGYRIPMDPNAKGDQTAQAISQAQSAVQNEYGVSAEDAAKIVNRLDSKVEAGYDHINVWIPRKQIADVIGQDKLKAQYEAEKGDVSKQLFDQQFEEYEKRRDEQMAGDTSGQLPKIKGLTDLTPAERAVAEDPFLQGTPEDIAKEQRVQGLELDKLNTDIEALASKSQLTGYDWKRIDPVKALPFVASIADMATMKRLTEAVDHIRDGNPSQVDLALLKRFAAQENIDKTWVYQGLDTLAEAPAFLGEMVATEGIYSGVKQGLKTGVYRVLRDIAREGSLKALGREISLDVIGRQAARKIFQAGGKRAVRATAKLAQFGLESATTLAASIPQTFAAAPVRIGADTLRYQLPGIQFTKNSANELSAIITKPGMDGNSAFIRAMANQYGEVFSEHSGGALSFIPVPQRLQALKAGIIKWWSKAKPGRTAQEFVDLLHKGGWHGVIGEMFEERVAGAYDYARGEPGASPIPSLKQLAAEGLSFGIMGGAFHGGQRAISKVAEVKANREESKAMAHISTEALKAFHGILINGDQKDPMVKQNSELVQRELKRRKVDVDDPEALKPETASFEIYHNEEHKTVQAPKVLIEAFEKEDKAKDAILEELIKKHGEEFDWKDVSPEDRQKFDDASKKVVEQYRAIQDTATIDGKPLMEKPAAPAATTATEPAAAVQTDVAPVAANLTAGNQITHNGRTYTVAEKTNTHVTLDAPTASGSTQLRVTHKGFDKLGAQWAVPEAPAATPAATPAAAKRSKKPTKFKVRDIKAGVPVLHTSPEGTQVHGHVIDTIPSRRKKPGTARIQLPDGKEMTVPFSELFHPPAAPEGVQFAEPPGDDFSPEVPDESNDPFGIKAAEETREFTQRQRMLGRSEAPTSVGTLQAVSYQGQPLAETTPEESSPERDAVLHVAHAWHQRAGGNATAQQAIDAAKHEIARRMTAMGLEAGPDTPGYSKDVAHLEKVQAALEKLDPKDFEYRQPIIDAGELAMADLEGAEAEARFEQGAEVIIRETGEVRLVDRALWDPEANGYLYRLGPYEATNKQTPDWEYAMEHELVSKDEADTYLSVLQYRDDAREQDPRGETLEPGTRLGSNEFYPTTATRMKIRGEDIGAWNAKVLAREDAGQPMSEEDIAKHLATYLLDVAIMHDKKSIPDALYAARQEALDHVREGMQPTPGVSEAEQAEAMRDFKNAADYLAELDPSDIEMPTEGTFVRRHTQGKWSPTRVDASQQDMGLHFADLEAAEEQSLTPLARSMASRAAADNRDVAEVAATLGINPADLSQVLPIEAAGNAGWYKFSMLQFLLHENNDADLEDAIEKLLENDPQALDMVQNGDYADRKIVGTAIMDAIAQQAGVERSSLMTPEDWDLAQVQQAGVLTDDTVRAMMAAGKATNEWHKNIQDFIRDPELQILAIHALAGKPVSISQVLRIGRKYGKTNVDTSESIIGLGEDTGLSDPIIKRVWLATVSGKSPSESIRSSAERAIKRAQAAEKAKRRSDEGFYYSEPGEADAVNEVDLQIHAVGDSAFKVSANLRILKHLLGEQMYSAPLAETVAKEAIQNSLDAVRREQLENGRASTSLIQLSYDAANRTITVADNGTGMNQKTIMNAFMQIGGSEKGEGEEVSGGLGMAKIALLFGPSRVDVTTIKNGKKIEFSITDAALDGTPVEFKETDTNEPNGTTQIFHIPENMRSPEGELRDIDFPDDIDDVAVLKQPLFGDVDIHVEHTTATDQLVKRHGPGMWSDWKNKLGLVWDRLQAGEIDIEDLPMKEDSDWGLPSRANFIAQYRAADTPDEIDRLRRTWAEGYDIHLRHDGTDAEKLNVLQKGDPLLATTMGRVMPLGNQFPLDKYAPPIQLNFSWGTGQLYISKAETRGNQRSVLSNGVFQFTTWDLVPGKLNHDVILNIQPKYKPTAAAYPFKIDREGWRHTVRRDIEAVKSFMGEIVAAKEAMEHAETYSRVKQVPTVDPSAPMTETVRTAAREGMLKEPNLQAGGPRTVTELFIQDGNIHTAAPTVEDALEAANTAVTGRNTSKVASTSMTSETRVKSARDFVQDLGLTQGDPLVLNTTNKDYVQIAEDAGRPDGVDLFTKYASVTGDAVRLVMRTLQEIFDRTGGELPNYSAGMREVELARKEPFFGVSIHQGYAGATLNSPFFGVVMNMLGIQPITKNWNPGQPPLLQHVADEMAYTVVHEVAHMTGWGGHNADFVSREEEAIVIMRRMGQMDVLTKMFHGVLSAHEETWRLMYDAFNAQDTDNIGVSVAGHESSQVDEPGGRSDGTYQADGWWNVGAIPARGTGRQWEGGPRRQTLLPDNGDSETVDGGDTGGIPASVNTPLNVDDIHQASLDGVHEGEVPLSEEEAREIERNKSAGRRMLEALQGRGMGSLVAQMEIKLHATGVLVGNTATNEILRRVQEQLRVSLGNLLPVKPGGGFYSRMDTTADLAETIQEMIQEQFDKQNTQAAIGLKHLADAWHAATDVTHGDLIFVTDFGPNFKPAFKNIMAEETAHRADFRLRQDQVLDFEHFHDISGYTQAVEKLAGGHYSQTSAAHLHHEVIAQIFRPDALTKLGLTESQRLNIEQAYLAQLTTAGISAATIIKAFEGVESRYAKEFIERIQEAQAEERSLTEAGIPAQATESSGQEATPPGRAKTRPVSKQRSVADRQRFGDVDEPDLGGSWISGNQPGEAEFKVARILNDLIHKDLENLQGAIELEMTPDLADRAHDWIGRFINGDFHKLADRAATHEELGPAIQQAVTAFSEVASDRANYTAEKWPEVQRAFAALKDNLANVRQAASDLANQKMRDEFGKTQQAEAGEEQDPIDAYKDDVSYRGKPLSEWKTSPLAPIVHEIGKQWYQRLWLDPTASVDEAIDAVDKQMTDAIRYGADSLKRLTDEGKTSNNKAIVEEIAKLTTHRNWLRNSIDAQEFKAEPPSGLEGVINQAVDKAESPEEDDTAPIPSTKPWSSAELMLENAADAASKYSKESKYVNYRDVVIDHIGRAIGHIAYIRQSNIMQANPSINLGMVETVLRMRLDMVKANETLSAGEISDLVADLKTAAEDVKAARTMPKRDPNEPDPMEAGPNPTGWNVAQPGWTEPTLEGGPAPSEGPPLYSQDSRRFHSHDTYRKPQLEQVYYQGQSMTELHDEISQNESEDPRKYENNAPDELVMRYHAIAKVYGTMRYWDHPADVALEIEKKLARDRVTALREELGLQGDEADEFDRMELAGARQDLRELNKLKAEDFRATYEKRRVGDYEPFKAADPHATEQQGGPPGMTPGETQQMEDMLNELRQQFGGVAMARREEDKSKGENDDLYFADVDDINPETEVNGEVVAAKMEDLTVRMAPKFLLDGDAESLVTFATDSLRTGMLATTTALVTNLIGNPAHAITQQLAQNIAFAIELSVNAAKGNKTMHTTSRTPPDIMAGLATAIKEGLFGEWNVPEAESTAPHKRGAIAALRYGVQDRKELAKYDLDPKVRSELAGDIAEQMGEEVSTRTGLDQLRDMNPALRVPYIFFRIINESVKRVYIAVDKPFSAFGRGADSRAQARRIAKNLKRAGVTDNWRKEMKKLVDKPLPEMESLAELAGQVVTHQTPNLTTGLVEKTRAKLITGAFFTDKHSTEAERMLAKAGGQAVYAGVVSQAPFVRTVSNIGIRVSEHDPTLAAAKAAWMFHRVGKSLVRSHDLEMQEKAWKDENKKTKADRKEENKAVTAKYAALRKPHNNQDRKNKAKRDAQIKEIRRSDKSETEKYEAIVKASMEYETAKEEIDAKIDELKAAKAAELESLTDDRASENETVEQKREEERKLREEYHTVREYSDAYQVLGRGGLGALVLVGLFSGILKGLFSLIGDVDWDEQSKRWTAMRAAGIPESSYKVDATGYWIPARTIPVLQLATAYQTAYEQAQREGTATEKTEATMKGLYGQALTLSPFTDPTFKDEGFFSWENLGRTGVGFTPGLNLGLLRQAGEVLDEEPRSTYKQGISGELRKRIPAGTPGLDWISRSTLPVSKHPLGGMEGRGDMKRRLIRLFEPPGASFEMSSPEDLPVEPLESAKGSNNSGGHSKTTGWGQTIRKKK